MAKAYLTLVHRESWIFVCSYRSNINKNSRPFGNILQNVYIIFLQTHRLSHKPTHELHAESSASCILESSLCSLGYLSPSTSCILPISTLLLTYWTGLRIRHVSLLPAAFTRLILRRDMDLLGALPLILKTYRYRLWAKLPADSIIPRVRYNNPGLLFPMFWSFFGLWWAWSTIKVVWAFISSAAAPRVQ